MNLNAVKVVAENNHTNSEHERALRKLQKRIYAEHPEYNPFLCRTRRRLFTTTSLYNLAFRQIINSGNSQLYVQAVKSIPKSLYRQILMYFITSHNNQTANKDLWLTVAAQNKIYTYDLDESVFTWDWLNLTLEQCFLFRCYNWLDRIPSFVHKASLDITTPYLVHMNSQFVGRTSSVCQLCIRRGFSNIEIAVNIKPQYTTVLSDDKTTDDSWCYTVFNEIQSWCCVCITQPLFTIFKTNTSS
jgi:hypothetical protein